MNHRQLEGRGHLDSRSGGYSLKPTFHRSLSGCPAPDRMSVDGTAAWIRALGCWDQTTGDAYAKLFKENKITGRKLPALTNESLEGLEITKLGHRLHILSAIQELYLDSAPVTPENKSPFIVHPWVPKQYGFSNFNMKGIGWSVPSSSVPVYNRPTMHAAGVREKGLTELSNSYSNYGVGVWPGSRGTSTTPRSCKARSELTSTTKDVVDNVRLEIRCIQEDEVELLQQTAGSNRESTRLLERDLYRDDEGKLPEQVDEGKKDSVVLGTTCCQRSEADASM